MSRGIFCISTPTSASVWHCLISCGPGRSFWNRRRRPSTGGRCGQLLLEPSWSGAFSCLCGAARAIGFGSSGWFGRHPTSCRCISAADRLPLRAGQFLNVRFLSRPGWTRANPFSLSMAPNSHTLRITAKALGEGSARLAHLRPGTWVLFEGPVRAAQQPGPHPAKGGFRRCWSRYHPLARAGGRPRVRPR
jgi:hypothetical protein